MDFHLCNVAIGLFVSSFDEYELNFFYATTNQNIATWTMTILLNLQTGLFIHNRINNISVASIESIATLFGIILAAKIVVVWK